MAARQRVTSARAHLDSLHAGVREASGALSRAEMASWKAAHEQGPAREATLAEAAEEMAAVARRSHGSADTGITIAGELRQAAVMVHDAREAMRDVGLEGRSPQDASDLVALGVRIDALGEVLELARPMATAASEYLYDAAFVASTVTHRATGEHDPRPGVNFTTIGTDLGRAEQNGQQLSRAIAQAEAIGHRVVGHAGLVDEAATRRMVKPSVPDPSGSPPVAGRPANDGRELGVEGTIPEINEVRVARDGAGWNDQTRTVWSDTAWLSTAQRLPSSEFETIFFAPDPARQSWRNFRVLAANREDGMRNHQLVERVITQDNQRASRRAEPSSPEAERCPTLVAIPSRLSWKRAALSIPPWIETSRLLPEVAAVGYTQPWSHPARNELRYRDHGTSALEPLSDAPVGSRVARTGVQSPSEAGSDLTEQTSARRAAGAGPRAQGRRGRALA